MKRLLLCITVLLCLSVAPIYAGMYEPTYEKVLTKEELKQENSRELFEEYVDSLDENKVLAYDISDYSGDGKDDLLLLSVDDNLALSYCIYRANFVEHGWRKSETGGDIYADFGEVWYQAGSALTDGYRSKKSGMEAVIYKYNNKICIRWRYKRGDEEIRNSIVIINGLMNNGNNVDSTVYSGYYYIKDNEYSFYFDGPDSKMEGTLSEWDNGINIVSNNIKNESEHDIPSNVTSLLNYKISADEIAEILKKDSRCEVIKIYKGGTAFENDVISTGSGDKAYVSTVTSNNEISILLDSKKMNFTQSPVIENGTTLVPMRAIFETMGASVDWDNETKTVTSVKDNTTIKLTLDSTSAIVNDKEISLAVPAKLINGNTMVPLRFVSESLGAEVKWDGESKTVTINSK